jgi:hypothetical protein
VNGDFETGSLSPWIFDGTTFPGVTGPGTEGTFGLFTELEGTGDDFIFQNVDLRGVTSPLSVQFDYQFPDALPSSGGDTLLEIRVVITRTVDGQELADLLVDSTFGPRSSVSNDNQSVSISDFLGQEVNIEIHWTVSGLDFIGVPFILDDIRIVPDEGG